MEVLSTEKKKKKKRLNWASASLGVLSFTRIAGKGILRG
jgi:hypothetical protein